MIIARDMAAGRVRVDLAAVAHRCETVHVPAGFIKTPDLEQYAWEYIPRLNEEAPRRPLPRLFDIIQALYAVSNAQYFIYTHLDIGLYPEFYLEVGKMITRGNVNAKNQSPPFYPHQEIELPEINKDVLHFILHKGKCQKCGNLLKAKIYGFR